MSSFPARARQASAVSTLRLLLCSVCLTGLLLGGCDVPGGSSCLPAPVSDTTAPAVELMIYYTDIVDGDTVAVMVNADTPGRTFQPQANTPVRMVYRARDPEGLRSLQLSVIEQRTVGIGTQRATLPIPPQTAECPTASLEGAYLLPERTGRRSLSVAVVAESWAGLPTSTDTHRLSIRTPSGQHW